MPLRVPHPLEVGNAILALRERYAVRMKEWHPERREAVAPSAGQRPEHAVIEDRALEVGHCVDVGMPHCEQICENPEPLKPNAASFVGSTNASLRISGTANSMSRTAISSPAPGSGMSGLRPSIIAIT